jgi:flagellar motor switch protein FliG
MTNEQLHKAAILIAALDSDGADAVLERIPPEQAALIRRTLVELPDIEPGEESAVIDEFFRHGGRGAEPNLDDVTYEPAARPATRDIGVRDVAAPFHFLQEAHVEDLGELLAGEGPQTVAVVVSHLPADQAAQTVAALPDELQAEVVRRLARLDDTDPAVLREVEAGLERRFRRRFPFDGRRAAGVGAVKRIMHEASPETRRHWLSSLARHDPRLAAHLTQPSFSFAELSRLSDDSWCLLVETVDPAIVTAALAGAEPEFAADVARRLPRADARRLQQAIDSLGPTRLSDLDAAQDALVRTARELELQGRLEWLDTNEPAGRASHITAAA